MFMWEEVVTVGDAPAMGLDRMRVLDTSKGLV